MFIDRVLFRWFLLFFSLLAFTSSAQTTVPFGGLDHDSKLPVEIASDRLEVNQSDGSAVFDGNVLIGQGDMRLSASHVLVNYSSEEGDPSGQIDNLYASGGVTLVSGSEAAEAKEAIYSIETGTIVMKGNVILTQGLNAMSGQLMTINLDNGSAVIEGRVKSIFQSTGSDN